MAEVVRSFPPAKRPDATYPWDEWLDGKIRKLTKGKDYQCATSSIIAMAHLAARKRELKVKCRNSGGMVYLQATRGK